jgi:hypothetical protein
MSINVVVSEDPKTRIKYSFNNYDSKDGLQGNEFNIRSKQAPEW